LRWILGTELPAATMMSNEEEARREHVVARVRPTVVQINTKGDRGSDIGSGVIIDKRGYIVTNNHVVVGEKSIQIVLFSGQTLSATLVGASPIDDLAILKVDPSQVNLSVAVLGDSSKLHVGQEVLAVGNPLGITQTVTSGIVSALGRNIATSQHGQILPGTIQTDAAINPGNSGGALVDLQGHLIGIPTLSALDPEFKAPANGVGFAIPSNRVRFIAPQIIKSGHVIQTGRAALEVQVTDVDSQLAHKSRLPIDQGALVVTVMPKGPGEKAGLRSGDIIVQIDNKGVSGVLSLSDALLSKDPGDTVAVKVYRGDQQCIMRVTLGDLPAQ
jgi:putative serine protease PepD